MVVIVGAENLQLNEDSKVSDIFETYPHLLEDAKNLVRQKVRIPKSENVLYARQKEFVVSFKGDRFVGQSSENASGRGVVANPPVLFLGTEDVLTCHVIVLHHSLTRVSALAHFDEYVRERGLNRFLDAFKAKVFKRLFIEDWEEAELLEDEDEEDYEWEEWEEDQEEEENAEQSFDIDDTVELHFVGGYADEAKKAERLTLRLLKFFQENPIQFDLNTLCVGPPNTRKGRSGRNEPIVGGVGFDLRSKGGKPFPANFNRHFVSSSPDEDLLFTLMLGPSLIRKPFKLKKLILDKEDEGYSVSAA